MRVAMIGQKGIPATYGGIERHVDEIARRLVPMGIDVDVFCRLYYTPADTSYHGVRLLRRPSIHTKHFDAITHVTFATIESMMRHYDIVHFHALGPALLSGLPRMTGSQFNRGSPSSQRAPPNAQMSWSPGFAPDTCSWAANPATSLSGTTVR